MFIPSDHLAGPPSRLSEEAIRSLARDAGLESPTARAAHLRDLVVGRDALLRRRAHHVGAQGRVANQAGDVDAALDEIERLLARPSWLSVHTLRLDPRWDPIRDHPRFQALLARYAGAASP